MRIIIAGIAIGLLSLQAAAEPIHISYSGFGSGSVDGVNFANANYEFAFFSDTDDIIIPPGFDASHVLYTAPYTGGTISVDGFGTGVLDNAFFPYINIGDLSTATGASIGIASNINGDLVSDLFFSFVNHPSLQCTGGWNSGPLGEPDYWADDCYKFDGPFAAITQAGAWGGVWASSIGTVDFVFNPSQTITFEVTAVPVPAAVWLFGSALAGLGWIRRKQTV